MARLSGCWMVLKKEISIPWQLPGILVNFRSGDHFVSGGGDKSVKLWGYDDGMCYYNGVGHSGSIVKVFF